MTQEQNSFKSNVFVNCPFDKAYRPLLQALLFTAIDCGLEPRIASERSDSGEVRLDKIKSLIRESAYSIHDISRMEPLTSGELPRFNMPFEVGLDLGCRAFGSGHLCQKKCLTLEKEQFTYRTVLSDIAGNDIKAHHDDPQILVRHVRDWILENTGRRVLSATRIWRRYNEFYSRFEETLKEAGYSDTDIEDISVFEFIELARNWRLSNPARPLLESPAFGLECF